MAQSFLSNLRTSISPSRRRSAEAAEAAKEQLLTRHLAEVLGKLEEQERRLLDFAQQLGGEESKA